MCKEDNISFPHDKDGTLPVHISNLPSLPNAATSPLSDESAGEKNGSRAVRSMSQSRSPAKKRLFAKEDRRRSKEELVPGVDMTELQRLQTILAKNQLSCESMLVEESSEAIEDPKTSNLVRNHEIELERIDQQLLELGPFANSAYVDGERRIQPVATQLHSDISPNLPSPPTTSRRSKRGRQASGGWQGRPAKRGSKNMDEVPSPRMQSGEGRSVTEEMAIGVQKIKREALKEHPKKKWRKVGSSGSNSSKNQSKEGLLEANSALDEANTDSNILDAAESPSSVPASMSSPSIIPAASEMEMLSLYLPSQRESWVSSPPDMQPSVASSTGGDSQGVFSPQNLALDANLSQSASSLLSENTEDENGGSEERPSKRDSSLATAAKAGVSLVFTSTIAVPTPTLSTVSHSASNQRHPEEIISRKTREQSRLQISSKEQRTEPASVQDQRAEHVAPDFRAQVRKTEPQIPRSDSKVLGSDSLISRPDPHPNSTPPSVPKAPEFSVTNLVGSSSPTEDRSTSSAPQTSEQLRTWSQPGEGVIQSPSVTGQGRDTDSPLLTSYKKRRTSSSSSHLSVKHPLDDNVASRITTQFPLPPPPQAPSVSGVSQAHWSGGTGTPEPTTAENKVTVINPYTLWPNSNQVPTEGTPAASPLSRYPYPNPFQQANWLPQAGVLSSLPFRPPMLGNPFKPMFGTSYLPYRYPFPTAQGMKASFPMAAFNPVTGTAANPQPQTPSTSGNFAFPSQTPLYPFPSNPAFMNLSETASRPASATPPVFQPQPFGTKDEKSGNENTEKLPMLNWMQPSLLGANFPAYFGATLGVQMPLTPNTISQPPNVNSFAPRLGTSLPNPLSLTSQVESNLAKLERRSKETSTYQRMPSSTVLSAMNVTQREPTVNKHQEGTSSPALEATRIPTPAQHKDQLKWKPVQEAPQLQNTSTPPPMIVPPPYAAMFPSFPVTSSTADVRSHVITNVPQLPGHVMPVAYATPVGRGRQDGSTGGGRGSPRNAEKKRLRIHQVKHDDFKPQVKKRRPWRRNSKDKDSPEDEKKEVKQVSPQLKLSRNHDRRSFSPQETANQSVPPTLPAQPTSNEGFTGDTYGLNILAACSIQSRDQDKPASQSPNDKENFAVTPLALSTEPQDPSLPRRPQMPSPVSLAGANNLLLLGKKIHKPTPIPATVATEKPAVTQVESTVVDSLLQLSSSVSGQRTEETKNLVQGRENRSASFSAAETMLMLTKTSDEEKEEGGDRVEGETLNGGLSVCDPEDVFDSQRRGAVQQQEREKLSLREAVEEAQGFDSEATNTDSEATLSPTSPPSWTALEPGCDHCGMESRLNDGTGPKPPLNVPSSPMKASMPIAPGLEPAATEGDSPEPEDVVTPPKAPQELDIKEMTDTLSPGITSPPTKEQCSHDQKQEPAETLLNDLKSTRGLLDGDSEADMADDREMSEEEGKRLLGSPVSSPAGTETGNKGGSMPVMETSETADRNEVERETSHSDAPCSPAQLQAPFESPSSLQCSSLPPSEMQHEESHAHESEPKAVELESDLKMTESELELEPDLKAAELESVEPSQKSEEAAKEVEAEETEELPPTKRPKLDDPNTSPLNNLDDSTVAPSLELKVLAEVSKPQSDLLHDMEEQAEEDKGRREGMEDEGESELPAESQNANESAFSQPSEMMEVVPSKDTPGSKNELQTSPSSRHGDSVLQTSGKDSGVTDASVSSDPDTTPATCNESSFQKSPLTESLSSVERPPSSTEEEKTTLVHGERLPSWSQFAAASITDNTSEQEHSTNASPESPSPIGHDSCDSDVKGVPSTTENPAGEVPSTDAVDDPVFPKGDDQKGDVAERHSPKHQCREKSNITRQTDEHVNCSTSDSAVDEPQQEVPPSQSASIAPQNRLSVDKPGFDRYQHRRRLSAQSLKHGKEASLDKETKMRPKSQPWLPKGLFEADPISMKASKKERSLEHERPGREREKQEHFDERHGFRKAKVPPVKPYRGGDAKVPAEKSKLAPHPRSYPPTNTPSHRHQRGGDTIPAQEAPRARSREPSKPHSRPSSRQGHHTSPVPSSHYHSPTRSNQRESSPPFSNDDPLVVRPRPHSASRFADCRYPAQPQ